MSNDEDMGFNIACNINYVMKEQTVAILKKELDSSKLVKMEDKQLYEQLKASLEDIRHGRITEWKPKKKTK